MKRPLPATDPSRALAQYHRAMRARQERDERELEDRGRNPEVPVPYAYTQVMAAGSDITADPVLGTEWALQRMDFFQVEPIARELDGRQLVVGEQGLYGIELNAHVTVAAPADPDDLLRVRITLTAPAFPALAVAQTADVDPHGAEHTSDLSVGCMWPLDAGSEIQATVEVTWAWSAATPTWSYHAEMDAWWYAPPVVDAIIGSS